ncbi:hypothetical protein BH24PSE2_BH24PSE2_06890 [soil metagenome]
MTTSAREPNEIERDADETRAAMSETLDALQTKLSPGQLLDRSLGYMREHGGDFAANLGNDVKSNPVPTLMVGIGLAWMMAGGRRPVAEPAYRADLTTGGSAHSNTGVKDKAQSAAQSVQGKARDAKDAAASRYADARMGFERMLEQQPLTLGGLAFALGATMGAAAPRTPKEEEVADRLRGNGGQEAKYFGTRTDGDVSTRPERSDDSLTAGIVAEPAAGGTQVEREAIVDLGGGRRQDESSSDPDTSLPGRSRDSF